MVSALGTPIPESLFLSYSSFSMYECCKCRSDPVTELRDVVETLFIDRPNEDFHNVSSRNPVSGLDIGYHQSIYKDV
jgi:hypothetical protein